MYLYMYESRLIVAMQLCCNWRAFVAQRQVSLAALGKCLSQIYTVYPKLCMHSMRQGEHLSAGARWITSQTSYSSPQRGPI
jgi:hypothetical protein